METKYVLTLWVNEYDYDGLSSYFEIVGESKDLKKLQDLLNKVSKQKMSEKLKENETWEIMDISGKEKPLLYDLNKDNAIFLNYSFKVGDGSGYNSAYFYFQIIAIDTKVELSRELFINKKEDWSTEFEVNDFFDKVEKGSEVWSKL